MEALLVCDEVMLATGVRDLDTGRIAENTDEQQFIPEETFLANTSHVGRQIFPMSCMSYQAPEPFSGS